MPELPEVELFRRFLDRHAGGRVLRRVSIHDHRLLRRARRRLYAATGHVLRAGIERQAGGRPLQLKSCSSPSFLRMLDFL